MATQPAHEAFANYTQRAVSPFVKLLTNFHSVPYQGESATREQEQRDLYAFFQAFYADLYTRPELFGLPVNPDDSIAEGEPDEKDKKQAVKRLLDKPRNLIMAWLDFLTQAGIQGSLDGKALRLDNGPALLKEYKVGKKTLAGLEHTGLAIAVSGAQAVLASSRFAAMMPALQVLAKHCAAYRDPWMGKFLFASCNFRALDGYKPQVGDFYRAFDGSQIQMVTELHDYFASKGYKAEIGVHAPFAWVVKYQGDRKIKATPLYQVEYDDRYARPLRMSIKCVSTARLADLLPNQSQLLQADFARRVTTCRGDACGWCRNQKTLGPATMEILGEPRSVCWYTTPDVRKFDENTVELIQEYEQMHARLAPEK